MRTCEGSCEVAVVPQLPCYCCYSNRAESGTALALLFPMQTLWSVHRMVDDEEKVVQKEVSTGRAEEFYEREER